MKIADHSNEHDSLGKYSHTRICLKYNNKTFVQNYRATTIRELAAQASI